MDFQLKKSVLIIKGQDQSLHSVESFLKNRDWTVHSTTSLKDALVYLVQSQPMFVLISIDHPNKKVQKLPKVLAASFPVCVGVFAENPSSAAYKILNALPTDYKLFPPVTGPAVERLVNKYIREQNQQQQAAITRASRGDSGEDKDNGMIAIKGGNGDINIKGDQRTFSTNAQELLAQMLAADGDGAGSSFVPSAGNKSENPDMTLSSLAQTDKQSQATSGIAGDFRGAIMQPGVLGKAALVGEGLGAGSKLSGHFGKNQSKGWGPCGPGAAKRRTSDWDMGPSIGKPTTAARDSSAEASGSDPLIGQGASHGPGSEPRGALKDDNNSHGSQTNAGVNSGQTPMVTDAEAASNNDHARKRKNKGSGWAPLEIDPSNAERPQAGREQSIRSKEEADSLVARCTQRALDQSVNPPNALKRTIGNSTHVACIVIESPRFSGYLVTAMGKNRKIDSSFIESVRARLFKFLIENGEAVDEREKAMDLNIKQVPFMDWAADCAEFLRKSIHKGDEVVMAFFPNQQVKVRQKDSAAEHMIAVQLGDIKPDIPLTFNIYLYFPRNARYVLYTPRGGSMLTHQKDKLMREGVKEVHVFKEEIVKVQEHKAQTYLNEKIEEFQVRQSVAQKVA